MMAESDLRDPVRAYIGQFVKGDDELVEHILRTCYSAETNSPLNLVVIAPTSEGKTFAITHVAGLFPNAVTFTDASAKSFFYDYGVPVDKEGNDISSEIESQKEILDNILASSEQKRNAKARLQALRADSMIKVSFDGKVLVFLDAPRRDLWVALKPLLSHDKRQMIYQSVDKAAQGQARIRKVLLEGWPASVFATARDEDQWQGWPEIKSRVVEVSPKMDPRKYAEGNKLTAQLYGLPSFILKKRFPESAERQAKDEVKRTRYQIQAVRLLGHADGHGETDNCTVNPFAGWLESHFPHETGPRMRQFKILLAYVNLSAYERADRRPKLITDGQARAIVVAWEDVASSLRMILGSVVGTLPEYKLQFWKDQIVGAYEAKARGELPMEMRNGKLAPSNRAPDYSKAELTSAEIGDFAAAHGYRVGPARLNDVFLKSLIEAGYVKDRDDPEDKRRKLYMPVREMAEIGKELRETANAAIIDPEVAIEALNSLQSDATPTIINYQIPGDMKHEARLANDLREVADYLVNGGCFGPQMGERRKENAGMDESGDSRGYSS